MDYQSKVGYSLAFKKKEIIYFSIGAIAIILLLLIFMPAPINYFLSLVMFMIALIFLGLGFLLMKTIFGVVVKIEGNNIKIYTADSLLLNPKSNEIIFQFGRRFHASCNITRNNISSVRKIDRVEEINQIMKMDNVFKLTRIFPVRFPVNKPQMEKISFVSDYSNLVEIGVRNLNVKYPSVFGNVTEPNSILGNRAYTLKNIRIIISVKNPDEFINLLKK